MKVATAYVVDDDASARKSLCWLLETENIATRAFASAEDFLEAWNSDLTGCILVDVRMPTRNGLELQRDLNQRQNLMPVIVLTGHADVPIAIQAMKQGACDFIEKPYSDKDLLASITSALELGRELSRAENERGAILSSLESLTQRETEVMQLVVGGSTNKVIAARLGISEKTVEVHRARVMEKTGAKTLSELVRISLSANNPAG
jgi:RNA polymerase sigma factor (sigma-70 family)